METMHMSPYELVFLLGVAGIIIQLILFIPLNFISCSSSLCHEGVIEPIISTFSRICILFNLYVISEYLQ